MTELLVWMSMQGFIRLHHASECSDGTGQTLCRRTQRAPLVEPPIPRAQDVFVSPTSPLCSTVTLPREQGVPFTRFGPGDFHQPGFAPGPILLGPLVA